MTQSHVKRLKELAHTVIEIGKEEKNGPEFLQTHFNAVLYLLGYIDALPDEEEKEK